MNTNKFSGVLILTLAATLIATLVLSTFGCVYEEEETEEGHTAYVRGVDVADECDYYCTHNGPMCYYDAVSTQVFGYSCWDVMCSKYEPERVECANDCELEDCQCVWDCLFTP